MRVHIPSSGHLDPLLHIHQKKKVAAKIESVNRPIERNVFVNTDVRLPRGGGGGGINKYNLATGTRTANHRLELKHLHCFKTFNVGSVRHFLNMLK